jgi:hypothetical protein
MCIGFQTGRDAMFNASRCSQKFSRVAPNSAGSIRIVVSQRVDRPYEASGMNSIPGTPRRASPTSRICSARWSAAVPDESAAAAGTFTAGANSRSNASTCGPSGAIQLD